MGGPKDDVRITCSGEVKKWTFHDDVIYVQPLMGSNEPGWKGFARKNRAHRTWGVYAFIGLGGGERCVNLNSK